MCFKKFCDRQTFLIHNVLQILANIVSNTGKLSYDSALSELKSTKFLMQIELPMRLILSKEDSLNVIMKYRNAMFMMIQAWIAVNHLSYKLKMNAINLWNVRKEHLLFALD